MNGLWEIVFEEVPPDRLASIVIDSIDDNANIVDVVHDGISLPADSDQISRRLTCIAVNHADTACVINLAGMKICDNFVPDVTLRIIRYDLMTDESILFTSTDCRAANISAADELYEWATRIGARYGVRNFSGGLYPAEDEDTRLFSRTGVGPNSTI